MVAEGGGIKISAGQTEKVWPFFNATKKEESEWQTKKRTRARRWSLLLPRFPRRKIPAAAVEISRIKPDNQKYIAVAIEGEQASPSVSQAQTLRMLDQAGELNHDKVDGILSQPKKEVSCFLQNVKNPFVKKSRKTNAYTLFRQRK